MEKQRRTDQELKKKVLKLEFCLQEARSQTRKLQRVNLAIAQSVFSSTYWRNNCLFTEKTCSYNKHHPGMHFWFKRYLLFLFYTIYSWIELSWLFLNFELNFLIKCFDYFSLELAWNHERAKRDIEGDLMDA